MNERWVITLEIVYNPDPNVHAPLEDQQWATMMHSKGLQVESAKLVSSYKSEDQTGITQAA